MSSKILQAVACNSKSSSAQVKSTSSKEKNVKFRTPPPRKVIESMPVMNSRNVKSSSTGGNTHLKKIRGAHSLFMGGIANKSAIVKPKKTAQSDLTISRNSNKKKSIDFCSKCGDVTSKTEQLTEGTNQKTVSQTSIKTVKNTQPIQQYYKNERFLQSSESIHEIVSRKPLNPIEEVPSNDEKLFITHASSLEFLLEEENIEEIKEFRSDNYFECHSSRSRIESKANSFTNHKCTFRFYLNERLFPVPLNTDHNNTIRCTECNLPLDFNGDMNGTIQAKVNIGNKDQSMTLILPVKENLIIKEKRQELRKDDDVLYFGVVKLDRFGNSMFLPTLPDDSLALRYQKGFKKNADNGFNYESVEKNDVIFI